MDFRISISRITKICSGFLRQFGQPHKGIQQVRIDFLRCALGTVESDGEGICDARLGIRPVSSFNDMGQVRVFLYWLP